MAIVISLLIRMILGVFLSWVFGYLVFFIIFFVHDFVAKTFLIPITSMAFIGSWFTSAGVAVGAGVYLAWVGTYRPRGISLAILILVLIASIGGAWTGYFYGTLTDDPYLFVYPWRRLTITPLIGASLAANIVGMLSGVALFLLSIRKSSQPDQSFFMFLGGRHW